MKINEMKQNKKRELAKVISNYIFFLYNTMVTNNGMEDR